MAVTEMLLGERALHGLQGGITYDPQAGLISGNINGAIDREPIGELRERFTKLKARDNLLGAVLARLGADPGARETAAHNAVVRLLADREAVSKIADCYVGAAEKIAQGFGLSATKPDDLATQVIAINTELTSALARAQERITELVNQAAGDSAAAFHDLCLAQDEIAKLKAEVEASTTREKRTDAALRSQMDDTRAAEAYIASLKVKLAESEMERIMAKATAAGMKAALQILECTMREKLRP